MGKERERWGRELNELITLAYVVAIRMIFGFGLLLRTEVPRRNDSFENAGRGASENKKFSRSRNVLAFRERKCVCYLALDLRGYEFPPVAYEYAAVHEYAARAHVYY